jgi:hypothetical protein
MGGCFLEGSSRVAPDMELEGGSREDKGLEEGEEAMARERAETPQEDEEEEKPSLVPARNITCS